MSLLWRALVALTLLLTSSRRLAEAQQRNGTTAGQGAGLARRAPQEPVAAAAPARTLAHLVHSFPNLFGYHFAEEALLQFKAAFPGWRAAFAKHRLGGWEPAAAPGSSGPCSWSFVECDAAGDVTKL